MKTKILHNHQINEAINLLKNGEIVALPTETVYGLAADAQNDNAINKIFTAKNRPLSHPLILHIADFDEIHRWARNLPAGIDKLANMYWPGPLTLILHKRKEVSKLITGGSDKIAIRIPDHPLTLEVITRLGNGVVAPSANLHKKTSPTKTDHVLKDLKGKISAVLDGGVCKVGLESTIIDMTAESPLILRPGVITASMIEEILKIKVVALTNHTEKVPGNMETHYQPNKPLFLLDSNQITEVTKIISNVAVIYYSDLKRNTKNTYYKMSQSRELYAKALYKIMHNIDSTNVHKILVEIPPQSEDWSHIIDRLSKAAYQADFE